MKRTWPLGLIATIFLSVWLPAQASQWGTPKWHVNIPQPGSGAVYTGNADGSFSIPLLQKTMRNGMPFSLRLSYNSDIWYNKNSGFSPVPIEYANSSTPSWGWLLQSQAGTIGVDSYDQQCYYQQGNTYINYPIINYIRYYDATGTMHLFNVQLDWTTNPCHTGTETSSSDMSMDGEGYYVYASISETTTLQVMVKGPDGTTYNYYGGSTGTYVAMEDTNGNEMTETLSSQTNQSETDYTDTTGKIIIKAITYTSSTCPTVDPGGATDPQCTDYKILEPASTSVYVDYWEYFKSQSVNTASSCSGITDYSGTALLPAYLTLPEYSSGSSWYYTFAYDSQGFLSQINYPTGGYTSYTYGSLCTFGDGTPASISTTYNDNHGNTGTTLYTRGSGMTTISRPDGSKEIVTYGSTGLPSDIQYYDTDGATLLKEIKLTVSGDYPSTAVTYMNGVKVSESDTVYNSNGQLTQQSNIDWARDSSGNTKSITNITYLSGSSYTNANILDKPTDVQIIDSSNNILSETKINYDNYSSPYQMGSITGLPNHDDANYSISNIVRGNPTSIEKMSNSSNGLTTYLGYDETGDVVGIQQPNGHQIGVSYANSTYVCGNSYISSISVPGGTESFNYECGHGDLLSSTGPNGNSTSYSYDSSNRLTSVSHPDGGGMSISYIDPNHIQTTQDISSGQSSVSGLVYDGLGRVIFRESQANSSNWNDVEMVYNAVGEVKEVSNPYSTSSPPGAGLQFTQYTYDGLGRITSAKVADGSNTDYQWLDSAVQITDPRGIKKILETGGLGHLWQVCEVSGQTGSSPCGTVIGAKGFLTTYTYDMAGRLTGVNENGQTRSWTYDELGRKLSSVQPESGKTLYNYDSVSITGCSSNAPGRLVMIDNAASQNVCLSYGANWQRLKSKALSSGQTYTYTYDSGNEGLGHLTSASGPDDTDSIVYDSMGRMASISEAISGLGTYTTNYSYNELSEPTQVTAPTGRQFNYSYDMLARLRSIVDASTGIYYLDRPAGAFNPASEVLTQYFGGTSTSSPLSMTAGYNNMLQLFDLKYLQAGSGGMELQYVWGNTIDGSGNVTSSDNDGTLRQMKDLTNSSLSMNYTWDDMNRLVSAAESDSLIKVTETFDPFGNRNNQSGTLNESFSSSSSTNQITGFTYDAAGRLIAGSWGSASSRSFSWDAQSELTAYSDSNNPKTINYQYDAFGRRIYTKNINNGQAMYYFYGADDGGHPLAEYNGSSWQTNVMAGGTIIATVSEANPINLNSPSAVNYMALDQLGNMRMTQSSVFQTYYPYGEAGNSAVSSEYTWTNQIRGTNSGMDHFWFRSYAAPLARWITPDPAGSAAVDPANPQSWNRYAYVDNNPLSLTDPLGLDCGDGFTFITSGGAFGDTGCSVSANTCGDAGDAEANGLPSGCNPNPSGNTPVTGGGGGFGVPNSTPSTNVTSNNNAPNKPDLFNCATQFANKYSIAGGLHALGIGNNGGVGGFLTNALGGNAFSGFMDAVTNGMSVADLAFSGTYLGFGGINPIQKGLTGVVTDAVVGGAWSSVTGAGQTIQTLEGAFSLASTGIDAAEFASGFGLVKLGYDGLSYAAGLFSCATN